MANLVRHLQDEGLYPISVQDVAIPRQEVVWSTWSFATSSPNRKQLALLCQQLATLVSAGLPIDRVFTILRKSYPSGPLGGVIDDIAARLRVGATLSAALAAHPAIFPKSFTSVVEAGELGSALPIVLVRLAELTARAFRLQETVRSALLYPIVLVVASLSAVVFILLFVLPQFRTLLEDAHVQFDLPTSLLFASSYFLREWWWLVLSLLTVAAATSLGLCRHPSVSHRVAKLSLSIPVLRDTVRAADGARFCSTLGTLLESGVPLASAAPAVAETLHNEILRDRLLIAILAIREGQELVAALERADALPTIGIHLARVGQETGRLATMLKRAGEILEQSVEQSSNRFAALLVPLLTVTLGAFVGGVIAIVFSALMRINDAAT